MNSTLKSRNGDKALGGRYVRGDTCRYPSPHHEDAHPSAGLFCGDDGIWRVKCHSCGWHGDLNEVLAAQIGRLLANAFMNLAPTAANRARYCDVDKRTLVIVKASAKMLPMKTPTEQLRKIIDGCGLTRYRIAKESGVLESTLSRLMAGHAVSSDAIDALADVLELRIVSDKAPAKGKTTRKAKQPTRTKGR